MMEEGGRGLKYSPLGNDRDINWFSLWFRRAGGGGGGVAQFFLRFQRFHSFASVSVYFPMTETNG